MAQLTMQHHGWKNPHEKPDLFRPEGTWRKPVHNAIAVFWAVVAVAFAAWMVLGGPPARQAVWRYLQIATNMVQDFISTFMGALR